MPKSVCRAAAILAACAVAALIGAAPAAAAADYDPHRVLVSFTPGASKEARTRAHSALQGRVQNRLEFAGLDVVLLPDGVDP
ncbi:MAG: hypothetical protein M3N47_14450, partial [Chloroflexota bacterium]|nr:hypothetical protein [Chloroflexota bacterium]